MTYGTKLFFVKETHLRRDGVDNRRDEQRALARASALLAIDHRGALCHRISDEFLQVGRLFGLRQRRDHDALLPWQPSFKCTHGAFQLGEEIFCDFLLHHDELDGRTTLSVVGRRSVSALCCRDVQICIWHDDAQVLAF